MITLKEPILVTSALPYANGDIHIGHLVEYIQTDIYVRFLKMQGLDAIYLCASDTHGTPVELKARELDMKPEELVAKYNKEHHEDFRGFQIEFDRFYTTHSQETRKHAEAIFEALREKGLIEQREVEMSYCETDQRYLPDRYVRGTCPKCGAADQYGDNCQVCGATYQPTEVEDARCVLCGNPPVRRRSVHYFFLLSRCQDELARWVAESDHLHETTKNWVEGTFLKQLRDWDISRDAPYFGFLIPGETDRYFYVWLDAPVGYVGTTEKFCEENGRSFDAYWKSPNSTVIHFIGKDIAYFHTLFWPAMLMKADYHTPDRVQVHGFLTVNGEKMSKRTGTAVKAKTYLRHLDPQYLRYYYACKLGPTNADIDLNLEDFAYRVNSDLVNKVANLASRSMSLLNRRLEGRVGSLPEEGRELLKQAYDAIDKVREHYEACEFGRATRTVVELAETANKYFQDSEPFRVVKEQPEVARGHCTTALNFVKVIAGLLKPVLPKLAAGVERSLSIEPLTWDELAVTFENRQTGKFERLVERVDPKKVEKMIEDSKRGDEMTGPKEAKGKAEAGEEAEKKKTDKGRVAKKEKPPEAEEHIDINTFTKVDLRVAKVVKAESVEGARALIRLIVDVGEEEERQVLAGLKAHYEPEQLEGRNVVLVANLKPRKMRFGVSQGMVLAASTDERVAILDVDPSIPPGSKIT
jgi:methionyl-tRNA synthetase